MNITTKKSGQEEKMVKALSKTIPKPIKLKLKKYQLKGLGWCGEVTAHKLTASQVKQVNAYAEKNDEDLNELTNMEGIVNNYDCYDTNLWQSGILPFLHGTTYAIVDSKNKILSSIEKFENSKDGPTFEIIETPEYIAEKKKGNVLVSFEEHKGTTAVWVLESTSIPNPKDFTFKLAKLQINGDDTLFVSSVYYNGAELERDYDQEFIVGKASYSMLL